jgi:hypothetical protein
MALRKLRGTAPCELDPRAAIAAAVVTDDNDDIIPLDDNGVCGAVVVTGVHGADI